jgi:hypothetical protein
MSDNESQNASHKRRRNVMRMRIFSLLGDKCSNPNCLVPNGCTDPRCLQIDHINGGGHKQRKELRDVECFYKYVLNHPEEYQLLCANCNWIKRYERNETRKNSLPNKRYSILEQTHSGSAPMNEKQLGLA